MNADRINEHYYGDLSHPTTQRCRQRIHWICQQAAGQKVLDVGCSQGITCILLAREGFDCTGVDIEQSAIEHARQALEKEEAEVQKRVRFQSSDAARLPFDDNQFDTVLLCEILEHLTHPERILKEVGRVLKDSGKVVITVPYGLLAHQDHKKTFYHISLLETVQPYFRTTLIDSLHTKQLVYCGVKDASYDWMKLPKEPLLRGYLIWEKEVEERCTTAELSLIETSGKLGEQIKTLRAQISTLDQQNKVLKETLQTKENRTRQELAAKQTAWQQQIVDFETRSQAHNRQLTHLKEQYDSRLREREQQLQALLSERDAAWKRSLANQRVRDVARACLPAVARVLVISKGDDDLLQLDGRLGWHFPQAAGGVYAGHHPASAIEVIAHLESLKAKGAEFLMIPASAFWWLEFYSDFRRHLESQYRLLLYHEETCAIFDLRIAPSPGQNSMALALRIATGKDQEALTEKRSAPEVVSITKPTPNVSIISGDPAATPRGKAPGAVLKVGGILDEFTAACFRPECQLISFRPDNWKDTLEANAIDLLFVESAWQGNGGSWQYKIASFKKPMGEEVIDVVNYCKARGIPTVLWNKEDPSHFDRFIHRAPLFDFVFTTDADVIPQYRAVVKHGRVFALPFAAQPQIHNPVLAAAREQNVCFAGAYYALDHDERRSDINLVLRPALKFGLHIYDRQHGVVGSNAKAYQFPDIYQPAIQGRLEYDDMVKAYKRYKVFLNVNSVKNSPTMFSRRVFELLASGTPVVSAYARGIEEMLGTDLVHLTKSEPETKAHLQRLLGDETYWAEVSVRGIREVHSHHTYAHRMAEICAKTGLRAPTVTLPNIEVLARVDSREECQRLTQMLKRQTYRRFSLTIIAGKPAPKAALEAIGPALPDLQVQVVPQRRDTVACLLTETIGDCVWLVNLDDFYGDQFLKDSALAVVYSEADLIGKRTHFSLGARGSSLQLVQPGQEYRLVDAVSPGSMIVRRGKLDAKQCKAWAAHQSFAFGDLHALSIDRFNYVTNAGNIPTSRGKAPRLSLARALV